MKKNLILIPLLYSSMQAMIQIPIAPNTSPFHVDIIPMVLSCLDLQSINNFLKTCTAHHKQYEGLPISWQANANKITSKQLQNLTYGIDRVLHDNPATCASLTKKERRNALIYYAQANDTIMIKRLIATESKNERIRRKKTVKLLGYNKNTTENIIKAYKGIRYTASAPSILTNPTMTTDHNLLTILVKNHYLTINQKNKYGYTALHSAAGHGLLSNIRLLLNHDADVNSKDCTDATPLHYAARYGHIKAIHLLIASGADIDSEDIEGNTPLLKALGNNHQNIASLLIKSGADINHQDIDGETPFNYLTYMMTNYTANLKNTVHYTLLNAVIKNGYPIDQTNTDGYVINGYTALHCAAQHGLVKNARLLLEHHANINSRNEYNATPLHLAAAHGHIDMTRLLIAKGADINAVNTYNYTPLLMALKEGYQNTANLLIKSGADINSKDVNGYTALHWAVQQKLIDSVLLLLAHPNVDINSKDNHQSTPLHVAASSRHVDLIQLLITEGADINALDKNDRMPLYRALRSKHQAAVNLLIESGSKITHIDDRGRVAVHYAAEYELVDSMKLLLNHPDANINSKNTNNNSTPLHYAAYYGYMNIVELLITLGADLNSKNNDGSTPLHIATSHGYIDIVRLLLEHGARVDNRNKENFTPFDLAVAQNHQDIITLFNRYNADISSSEHNSSVTCNTLLKNLLLNQK